MAFAASALRPIRDLGVTTFWHYLTADAAATVDTTGYFNDAADMLNVGDVILRVTVDAVAAPTSVSASGFHLVLSNTGTVVDTGDALVIAVTDTD